MKKNLGLFLSILLVIPIILTGCGRDGKKLLEEAMKNTGENKSSKIDAVLSAELDLDGVSVAPGIQLAFAFDKDSAHLNFSADSFVSTMLFQSLSPVTVDLYVQNDQGQATLYANDIQGDGYIKTTLPAGDLGLENLMDMDGALAQSGAFSVLANLSKSIKVVGTEEVNGKFCDVVNVTLDFAKISSFSESANVEMTEQQKVILNVLSECIDFKYYVGRDDVRLYGMRVGVNDKLTSMLNQLLSQENAGSMKLKNMQLEFGITVDYENELEALPANVQNAESLSNEEFESRYFFSQMIQPDSHTYDEFLPDGLYEDSYDYDSLDDGFWDYDGDYYDDVMGS